MRICSLLLFAFLLFGVTLVTAQYSGVSASITATATVSQPIGLVEISYTTSSPTLVAPSDRPRPFALLAPKISGVIVSVDGIAIDRPGGDWFDARMQRSISMLSLPLPASPTPTIITLIYSEN